MHRWHSSKEHFLSKFENWLNFGFFWLFLTSGNAVQMTWNYKRSWSLLSWWVYLYCINSFNAKDPVSNCILFSHFLYISIKLKNKFLSKSVTFPAMFLQIDKSLFLRILPFLLSTFNLLMNSFRNYLSRAYFDLVQGMIKLSQYITSFFLSISCFFMPCSKFYFALFRCFIL